MKKVDFSELQIHLEDTYALAFLLSEVHSEADNSDYWQSAMRVLYDRIGHAFLKIAGHDEELNGRHYRN